MRRTIRTAAALLLAALAAAAPADDKTPAKPKAVPEGTPLELHVTGKTTRYTLDTGLVAPEEYKKTLDAAVKAGGKLPPTPEVDLTVEIKNTSDKPLNVWVKGDPVVLELVLKGGGAVNAEPRRAFTQQFNTPEAVEIPPGKAHAMPLKNLDGGFRRQSKFAYWGAKGEYELTATLKTGVSPAPKGAPEADGFGVVTLTSAPFKLTVE